MPKSRIPAINLIKSERRFIEVFTSWALTVGRGVVVMTEIIALSAFLYRFYLDRQLIDLHDDIKRKETIVKLSKPFEDKYRNIQERLDLVSKLSAIRGPGKTFKDILGFAPSDIKFNNVRITDENIRIDANVNSVSSLKTFVKNLRAYDAISTVSIDKIENRTSSATIVISITAVLQKNTK